MLHMLRLGRRRVRVRGGYSLLSGIRSMGGIGVRFVIGVRFMIGVGVRVNCPIPGNQVDSNPYLNADPNSDPNANTNTTATATPHPNPTRLVSGH